MKLNPRRKQTPTQPRFTVKALTYRAIAFFSSLGLVSIVASTSQAQEALTNNTIQFPEDTIVEFELIDTHGYYQSTFGVVDGNTRRKVPLFVEVKPYDEVVPSVRGRDDTGTRPDYPGTVQGGAVVNGEGQANQFIKYTFKAGVPYAFYMDSVDPVTKQTKTAYISTNSLAARLSGNLEGGDSGNLIEWDDSGLPSQGKDSDFDDFAIIAGGYALTPCPLKR